MSQTGKNIVAIREGEKREFAPHVWDQLPDHKHGWKRAVDEPEEVKKLKKAPQNEDPKEPGGGSSAVATSTSTTEEAQGGAKTKSNGPTRKAAAKKAAPKKAAAKKSGAEKE